MGIGGRTIASLMVKLGMDPKEADIALKKFEKNLKDSGRRMESIGKTMSIGFTAPFLLAMRSAIKAYDEEAQAVKKLEVALGGTSKALLNQAAAIQKTTIYSDDAVISVQAWAAALGHGEVEVGKMTTAAVGLAAGLGIGLDQAMSMLHKTTLGATKGLGNLVPGVKNLTAEQLKSGAAIDLVTAKFGNYAQELAKTGAGPLKVFQNRFGDLMEQFGEAALPLLNKIIDKFSKLTEWFSKLSPETKELAVNFGAIVALAGPVLLMAGNVIKLTSALSGLAASLKAIALIGGGLPALILALSAAVYTLDQNLNPMGPNGNAQKFAGNVASWAAKKVGFQPKSSQYGSAASLIPGYSAPDNSGMLMSTLKPAAFKVPGGGGGGSSSGQALSGGWWKQDQFSSPREQYANEKAPMLPFNLDLSVIDRALPKLDDLKSGFSGVKESLISMTDAYTMLGEGISGVVGSMISAFGEGSNAFAAFGKAALGMAAQVVKAMLAVVLAKATAAAAQGGPVAAVIGLGVAIGVVETLQSMIGKIKVPKLAQGGATAGPMMAMIGDNPSGKEMVMPWEKTGDFARKIGREMGGGGGNMSASVVLRGDDLHMVVKKAQDRAVRRGSGNTITF